MGERERFTPEEWRTLEAAATAGGGPLGCELLASVLADHDRLTAAYRADPRTIGVGLVAVSAVLDRAAPEAAAGFKGMLVSATGEGVARARGRFGVQMSGEDANAVTLAVHLGGRVDAGVLGGRVVDQAAEAVQGGDRVDPLPE